MRPDAVLSRRGFMVLAGAAGLSLGLASQVEAAAQGEIAFAQTFLKIDADSTVTVFAKHLDMGQGIWSGLASIVAEELDADWAQVRVEGAPAAPEYKNLFFGSQTTGGSTSTANSFDQMRKAGAVARAMLIQAAADRWGAPPAEITVSAGVVRHAASKRTLTFGDLATKAAALPVPERVAFKDPKDYVFLGKAFPRLDSLAKSTGAQVYGMDVRLPGMKVAMVRRAPRFGGVVKSFDASAARKVAGVVDVVQVPSGVVVIAENTWAARLGREALVVDWDDTAAEMRSSDQILADFRKLADTGVGITATERGQPPAAMAAAAKRVDAEFEFPFLAHAPMEPLVAVCAVSPDGVVELWGGIQSQTANQKVLSDILATPIEKVKIHTLQAGGSFGRRATLNSDWIVELAHIVKAIKAAYPVKVMWTREDDLQGGYYRPISYHRMAGGLSADGKIVALQQTIVSQSLLYGIPFGAGDITKHDFTATEGAMAERYDIADAKLLWIPPKVHVPVTLYRSVGNTHTTFAKEVFMDRLARAAGVDPLQMRLNHLASSPRQAAVLRLAADKAGWGHALPPGVGLGVAVQEAFKSFIAQVAQVSVKDGEIRVERVVCAIDCGFALNPDVVRAQMEGGIGFGLSAALHDAITLNEGLVEQTNFDAYQILRMHEAPREIEVHILNSGASPTGVGEPGATPIAAAVANAIYAATGKSPSKLPLSLA